MTRKKCEACGGNLRYTRSDSHNSYYECPYCGELFSFSNASEGGTNLAFESAKAELLGRLRRGFDDWRVTQWDQLYKDFVDFTSAHEQLQHDLEFQMALIACLTKGFNSIDPDRYQQCKTLFKITDDLYKAQLKALKAKAKKPALSDSFAEYEAARAKFTKLQNDYANSKTVRKLLR